MIFWVAPKRKKMLRCWKAKLSSQPKNWYLCNYENHRTEVRIPGVPRTQGPRKDWVSVIVSMANGLRPLRSGHLRSAWCGAAGAFGAPCPFWDPCLVCV